MRVHRIYNGRLLKDLLMKAPELIEDNDDPGSFDPDMTSLVVLAMVSDQAECIGCLVSRQLTANVAEVQFIIDKKYRGHRDSTALGKLAIASLPGTHKLVSTVPTPDKELLRYFQRVGFQREGVNRKSFARNGELLDQYYVGKARE